MIQKYFPYKKPREGQIQTIKNIINAINENNYKYICLDAPTGYGKTAIAQTINNYYTQEQEYQTYIITSTKILQDQYKILTENNKFKINYKIAKGKTNYHCKKHNTTADKCKDKQCQYKNNSKNQEYNNGCEYWNSKIKAIQSDTALLNYNLKIADTYYQINHYKMRNLAILDEAHNIENAITNTLTLKIPNNTYTEENLQEKLKNIKTKNTTLKNQIQNTLPLIEENPDNWTITQTENTTTIKPTYIQEYTKDLLLKPTAQITIFMSGSFIETNQFLKDLGINDDVYIEKTTNNFNLAKNNPIIIDTAGNMSWNAKQETIPKTYTKIQEILNKHPKEKGIIHTHKKEYTKNIIKHFKNTKYKNRITENIEEFKKSTQPLILISHNIQEGIDFKYDQCRFQILYKAPFPPLNDNQILKRLEYDQDWYCIKTMQKFQQTIGRAMRAKDDYCKNYLIDSGFYRILNPENPYLPFEIEESIENHPLYQS